MISLPFLNAGSVQSKRVDACGVEAVYKPAPQNCENPGANHSKNVCDRLSEKQVKISQKLVEKNDSQVHHPFDFMNLPDELQRYTVCLAALDWQSADVRLLKGDYVTLDELRQNGFKLSKGALALREVSGSFNQLMMDNGKGPGCLAAFTPRQQSHVEACLLGPYPRVVRLKDEGLRCVMQDSFLKNLSEKKSETQHWPRRIEVFMDDERNIKPLSVLALHEALSQRVVSVKIKTYDAQRLEGLKDFPYLETLTIDVGIVKDFKSLPNLPQLSDLRITGKNVKSFEGFENLKHLKSFFVDVYYLHSMKGLKNCHKLSSIDIKALGLFCIAGMRDLPKLKDLHITSFDLKNKVHDLANLPTLRKLSIISSVRNVEKIKSLTQLKELSIIAIFVRLT